jgi:hypothetical protein
LAESLQWPWCFSWLPDCKGEGAPGTFEKFLAVFPPPVTGRSIEEMCSAANDGKRFWLDGYLQLPTSISISGGKTRLDLYSRIDGNGRGSGRPIGISVRSPGDIDDLWATASNKKSIGYRGRKGEIDPDALRIRATNGAATPRDKIKLTFDVEGINLQDEKMATCRYHFVKAEKF